MNLMYSYYTVYYICIIEAVSHMLSKENHQSIKKVSKNSDFVYMHKKNNFNFSHSFNQLLYYCWIVSISK